ncbi:MAG: hypothetical protein EOO89_00755 [Pedobacter sp.]|nr:MAG: hypothetical protein EOO89_00755 [Pedobacter sp.]
MSFEKFLNAYFLHSQLTKDIQNSQLGDVSVVSLMSQKDSMYQTILSGYDVKLIDREGVIWRGVSSLAINNGIDISYVPKKTNMDSSELVAEYWQQEFVLNGNYYQLVGMLDSLHKTAGLGRVATAEFKLENPENVDKKVLLKVLLKGTLK